MGLRIRRRRPNLWLPPRPVRAFLDSLPLCLAFDILHLRIQPFRLPRGRHHPPRITQKRSCCRVNRLLVAERGTIFEQVARHAEGTLGDEVGQGDGGPEEAPGGVSPEGGHVIVGDVGGVDEDDGMDGPGDGGGRHVVELPSILPITSLCMC
jgi:hypothetical protein